MCAWLAVVVVWTAEVIYGAACTSWPLSLVLVAVGICQHDRPSSGGVSLCALGADRLSPAEPNTSPIEHPMQKGLPSVSPLHEQGL